MYKFLRPTAQYGSMVTIVDKVLYTWKKKENACLD